MKSLIHIILFLVISKTLLAQPMSGNYRIGSAAACDFTTIAEAFTKLKSEGVLGSIDLLVDPGTYTDNLELLEVPGWQDRFALNIIGNTTNPDDVVISYTGDYPCISIGEISNFKISNIKVELSTIAFIGVPCFSFSTNYCRPNVTIEQCNIITSPENNSVYISSLLGFDSITISQTELIGLNAHIFSNGDIQNLNINNVEVNEININSLEYIRDITINDLSTFTLNFYAEKGISQAFFSGCYFDEKCNITSSGNISTVGIHNCVVNTRLNAFSLFLEGENIRDVTITETEINDIDDFVKSGVKLLSYGVLEDIEFNNVFSEGDESMHFEADTIRDFGLSYLNCSGTVSFIAKKIIDDVHIDSSVFKLSETALFLEGADAAILKNIHVTENKFSNVGSGLGIYWMKEIDSVEVINNEIILSDTISEGMVFYSDVSRNISLRGNRIPEIISGGYCKNGAFFINSLVENLTVSENIIFAETCYLFLGDKLQNISIEYDTLTVDDYAVFSSADVTQFKLQHCFIDTEKSKEYLNTVFFNGDSLRNFFFYDNYFYGKSPAISLAPKKLSGLMLFERNMFQINTDSPYIFTALTIYSSMENGADIGFNKNTIHLFGATNASVVMVDGIKKFIADSNYISSYSQDLNTGFSLVSDASYSLSILKLSNNIIEGFNTGISAMTDGDSVIVTSNTFRENNYGLSYVSEEEYLQVDGNKFVSESEVPGVAINIKRKFVNGETNIFNNTVSGINYKALFLDEVLHPKIEHNSFSINSGILSLSPIRLSDSYDITFQNNIIQHKGSSGWFIEFDTITTIKMDNNLYYSPNELDTFIYTANNIAYSLAEWKEIQTGLEANSLYLNEAAPFVNSSNDLHIDCSQPLPIQAVITKLTTDIDGDVRKGFINIGADQTKYTYERLNAEVYDICDGDSVFLEAKIIDGAVYDWKNGAKESGLYHSDSGSYLATTFSACVAFEQPFEVVVSHMPVADYSYTITNNSTVECKNKSINGNNYTWDMGDGSIYTSEDVVHTYTSTGSYEVLLVVDNECFTNSVAQVVNLETSPFFTPQGKKYADISIFPTRVESFVQLASVQEGVYSLKILDVCGRVVLDKNNLIINEAGIQLDISGLRPALYFIECFNQKTGSLKVTKKILKQ